VPDLAAGVTDDAAVQTHALRVELRALCLVMDDRAGVAHGDAIASRDALTSADAPLRADLADLRHTLDANRDDLVTELQDEHDVKVSNVAELADPIAQGQETTGGVLHADLWFLIGLAAAALPAYGLYRLVMPRA